jgi:ureidoacrylate peracid hydrolase
MIGSRHQKHAELAFDERIDPKSTALLIIDVQNDFALPQGVCGTIGDDISPVAPMLDRLKLLIEAARQAKVFIMFVRAIYDDIVLSPALAERHRRRGYPNSICLTGTHGAEFVHGIAPRDTPNEVLVTKHRYSAFCGSSIDLWLRNNAIRTLVLTGIATEVCVESTARDAFFRDYQIVIPADCVGSYSEERQNASLTVLARSFGIVTSSDDIMRVWRQSDNGPRNWQPASERALTTLASKVNPKHTALLLMRSRWPQPSAEVRLAMRHLLDDAREAACLVIHASPAALNENDGKPELDVLPRGDEQVVIHHRTSAFADTQLELLLRSNGMRTIVVAGGETNLAVESTVREAFDRDYHAIVAQDCLYASASDQDLQASALITMQRHFATVVCSKSIRACWTRSA